MITDRLTARVIGLLLIIFPVIIDVSSFIFVKPELRSRGAYPFIVILPSLPFLIGGVLLLRRAERMKEDS